MASVTDFGLYALSQFRAYRWWHWRHMNAYRTDREPIWLQSAKEARLNCRHYAQLARKHGYGH